MADLRAFPKGLSRGLFFGVTRDHEQQLGEGIALKPPILGVLTKYRYVDYKSKRYLEKIMSVYVLFCPFMSVYVLLCPQTMSFYVLYMQLIVKRTGHKRT